MSRDAVLVVRHGPGRGRVPGYGEHVVEWLRAERPNLARRIRVHETGGHPPDLEDVRAVFFWLADPLEVLYPECMEEAVSLQEAAEMASLRVLNPPTVLARYGKDDQYRKLAAASVPTPRAVRIEGLDDLRRCADELGFPLMIRGTRTHSQEKTRVVRRPRDLRSLAEGDLPERALVTPLIDTRGRLAGAPGRDLWSRLYHRKRLFLIGEECVPHSLFFARGPVVSQDTSIYADYLAWVRHLSRFGRVGKPAMRAVRARLGVLRALALEAEYSQDPLQHQEVFQRAGRALGLSFLAFDYAALPGGDPVVWEANPYPFLPVAADNVMPVSRRCGDRLRALYEAFARCFESLLDMHPSEPV